MKKYLWMLSAAVEIDVFLRVKLFEISMVTHGGYGHRSIRFMLIHSGTVSVSVIIPC